METDSDNEIDKREHKRLVDNVLNLNTRQYVDKPTRSEPTAQISEYHLVKSLKGDKDTVRLYELTKSLKKRAVDVELKKKVKRAEVKSKTLLKPLEKPQAERIRRSTAYETTKAKLDRWEPLVTSNRVSTNLSFPLKDPNFDYKEARDFTSNWVVKSNLEKELEKLEPKIEVIKVEVDNPQKLTLKEMIQKRKELAKLRRHQSYKEIKARMQNKIKSKKFRKIQRKERMKVKIKDFEELQKSNPEEALKKLEEIERARAEERASLRHKSTGKWARNHQIRAKYDKESRKVLAEQLSISKDLTQKQSLNESSESEDEDNNDVEEEPNLWKAGIEQSKELKEFISEYRKLKEGQDGKNSEDATRGACTEKTLDETEDKQKNGDQNADIDKLNLAEIVNNFDDKQEDKKSNKTEQQKGRINIRVAKKKELPKRKKNLQVDTASAVWEVTSVDLESDATIDDIFDNLEYKMKENVNKKLEKVKSKLDRKSNISKQNKKLKSGDKKKNKIKAFQPESAVEQVNKSSVKNSELPTKTVKSNNDIGNKDLESIKSVLESHPEKSKKSNKNLVPDSTENVKTVLCNSAFPDILSYEDNEEDAEKIGLLTEGFEDCDIAKEFEQEKKDEVDKDRPKDLDLTLPGWGSWGGKDIPIAKRKKKRFILKAPKKFPRKDFNKGNLIINESANDNIKSHLVSDVPFPFKAVKDFEASMRAPIGNTFVPETAFRKMIKPGLMTRMGSVIEPITEDYLLQKEKMKKKKKKKTKSIV